MSGENPLAKGLSPPETPKSRTQREGSEKPCLPPLGLTRSPEDTNNFV